MRVYDIIVGLLIIAMAACMYYMYEENKENEYCIGELEGKVFEMRNYNITREYREDSFMYDAAMKIDELEARVSELESRRY